MQKVFYKPAIFLFLDAASAIADFPLWFYKLRCGAKQILLRCDQLFYYVGF